MLVRACGFESHSRHQQLTIRGDVAKWLRQGFAKPLFGGSIPPVASNKVQAGGRIALASSPTLDQPIPPLNTRSSTLT